MNWVEIKNKPFKYSGKTVTRRKVQFNSIFGTFEVFEAAGGNTFFRHPFQSNSYELFGYNNGLEDWFGKSKTQCLNIEAGKKICEEALAKAKAIVQSY